VGLVGLITVGSNELRVDLEEVRYLTREWIEEYNYRRPYEALNNLTPDEWKRKLEFEEIIYRAFLFGMLYRFTRLGFLPSVFLGSLLFGVAHLSTMFFLLFQKAILEPP